MSRVQLALRVPDLAASVAYYSRLFGAEPAKLRPGYANFALTEPPLKLVLFEGGEGLDHLGIEVDSAEEVRAAQQRFAGAGLEVREEFGRTCCHATQDKVWVQAPGQQSWEVYTVLADAPEFGDSAGCCT